MISPTVISAPGFFPGEAAAINRLFDEGLAVLHLRKPGCTEEALRHLLESIDSLHYDKIALHQHHHLAAEFGIRRLHLPEQLRQDMSGNLLPGITYSTSVHSEEAYQQLPTGFAYTFFGPVADSISKEGYKAIVYSKPVRSQGVKLIALGGIHEENCLQLLNDGFDGVALLGAVWNSEDAVDSFKRIRNVLLQRPLSPDLLTYERPFVLSIAGFDPSGGAGVLADIKTFEMNKCMGLAVLTANTIQTEHMFLSTSWQTIEQIKAQALPLIEAYTIDVVKIGIMESLDTLHDLVWWLKEKNKAVQIIWDPVISSSTGHSFLTEINRRKLSEILSHITLVTPNVPEVKILAGMEDEHQAASWLAGQTNVLLKGGHSKALGTDRLWVNGQCITLKAGAGHYQPKHGSGCILSSAIAAQLASGQTLHQSCITAKKYIESILSSNKNLLAYHYV